MQRVAFKMKLFNGCANEYKKRHDEIGSDLKNILKQNGIADYSIFLDEATHFLFAYLTIENKNKLDELKKEPLMQQWWIYMKDIMETNKDSSPVVVELTEVFYME